MFYAFMLGMTIIILALALAFPVKQQIDAVRNATYSENYTYEVSNGTEGSYLVNGTITHEGLGCSNASISNYDKGACLVADLGIFYFVGALIFIGGAVLTAKVIFS